jgi:two-component system chemotaxis response regulator CheY
MDIITENAEQKLLEELNEHYVSNSSVRCLHLRLSNLVLPHEETLPDILEILDQFIPSYQCRIFICSDHDIFILDRSLTFRMMDKIFVHLNNKFFNSLQDISINFSSLHEIRIDYQRLKNICGKKIENLQNAQEDNSEMPEIEIEMRSREELLNNINRDLLSSLSMRRDIRKNIEVMVVEDDLFSQRLVSNALDGLYDISMTGDGQGAILNYVRKAPDVLFLDINLPDIDGHEVLEKIFEIDPHAYVVMFSGNGDRKNVTRAVELGAKGFIGKPFTKEKLFQYIEKSPFIQAKKKEQSHGDTIH